MRIKACLELFDEYTNWQTRSNYSIKNLIYCRMFDIIPVLIKKGLDVNCGNGLILNQDPIHMTAREIKEILDLGYDSGLITNDTKVEILKNSSIEIITLLRNHGVNFSDITISHLLTDPLQLKKRDLFLSIGLDLNQMIDLHCMNPKK